MPTYDYKCKACAHRFELFQSMADRPQRKCPQCGKSALERLIGVGAAVLFKGSGFYQTDYRSDSYKKSAEADTKPATAADKPADSKADAKTPAKQEPKAGAKPVEPARPSKRKSKESPES